MNKVRFDFGVKPAETGYIKIDGNCLYDDEKGYGIINKAEGTEKERGEKSLCRDYLLFDKNTFKVKLDNGKYNVRVYSGDYIDEGDVTTIFKINSVPFGLWVSDGTVCEHISQIDVTDGFMEFYFEGRHACLNAIDIAPVKETDIISAFTEIEADKDNPAIILKYNSVSNAEKYKIYRRSLKNCFIDKAEEISETVYKDNDVSVCGKYRYTICALDDFGFEIQKSEDIDVYVTDGKMLTSKVEGFSADTYSDRVEMKWMEYKNALYYNVYQKAPYGNFKLIASVKDTQYTDNDVKTTVEFIYAVEAVTISGVTEKTLITTPVRHKKFKRKMETLNRGLIAVKTKDGVFLSWRLNGYEFNKGIDFCLFRNGEKITGLITDSTNYLDKDGKAGDKYTVKAVRDGYMEKDGYTTDVLDAPYFSIPMDKPEPYTTPDGNTYDYHANDAAVADLDGDGEYELVVKWVANGKDNSHKGYTGVVYLDGYKLDGTKLWRINLGVNIRSGAHYTQFMVYDFNNDGRAEMVCKTADGTIDGVGNVIGNKDADYRNKDGFILEGDEFLTLFDGLTGEALDTVDYEPPRGNVADWGDSWGNRVDRFLACVAYLDGENPSVVMCRGYYDTGRPTVLAAYDIKDNKLVKKWVFRADKNQNIEFTNQGNHNLGVGDIDGDGRDEIVYGACAIDHDGTGMYSTGLEHGDAMHLGKFTTKTPNLDFFQIHEHDHARYGYEVRDPATGDIKWGRYTGRDTTRGLCANIDPRYEGCEVWVLGEELYTFDGKLITKNAPESINFAIWWDGDLQRELLDHEFFNEGYYGIGKIYKWNYEKEQLDIILDTKDAYSNNGTKGNPCIQACIFGDWREDVVWRNKDSSELRIYTTTHLTNHKFYTLMHDPVYRLGVAWQNTAYNQPPHTGFYIGKEMSELTIDEHEYVMGENIPEFTEKFE